MMHAHENVQDMVPNFGELQGRLEFTNTRQPDADIQAVMRVYIIDASAQLMSGAKAASPKAK